MKQNTIQMMKQQIIIIIIKIYLFMRIWTGQIKQLLTIDECFIASTIHIFLLLIKGTVKEKWKGYKMKPENLRRSTYRQDVSVSRNLCKIVMLQLLVRSVTLNYEMV